MLDRIVIFLFSLNKEVERPPLYIMISLIELNLFKMILVLYVKRYGKSLIITSSLMNLKTETLVENYDLIGIGELYSLIIVMIICKLKCKNMTRSKSESMSMIEFNYKSMTKYKV